MMSETNRYQSNQNEEDGHAKNKPVRVLMIEDRLEKTQEVKEAFENLHAVVLDVTSDSEKTLLILRETKVDLLMLDLTLSQIDGIALLRVIQTLNLLDPPVIILVTPLDSEVIINEASHLGAAFVFVRPIAADFLAKRALEVYWDAQQISMVIDSRRYNVRDVRAEIVLALKEIGIPSHLLGYQYLLTAILRSIEQNGFRREVTTRLYPFVAEQHNSTPQKVERSIRHAIEATWSRGDINNLYRIFGNTVARNAGRPTNSEFLARMTDYVIIHLKADKH